MTTPTTGTSTTTTATTTTTTTTSSTESPSLGGGETTPTGGGGQVGLLLISKYVKKGTIDVIDYENHYALLADIEGIFGLKRLGYAADPGLLLFDSSTFDGS